MKKKNESCKNEHRQEAQSIRLLLYGMMILLIIIIGIFSFLYFKQQSSLEYLYFAQDNDIWRIGTSPEAVPEPYLELGDIQFQNVWHYDFNKEAGLLTYINGVSIYRYNVQTNTEELILDCSEISSYAYSQCVSFDIHPDGNQIAYVLEYYDPEISSNELHLGRSINLDAQTDELLFDPMSWVYRIRWADENHLEYTTGNREWWMFDTITEDFTQVEYDDSQIYSPNRHYYVQRSGYEAGCCRYRRRYAFYHADGELVHDNQLSIESEARSNTVYWRPDSSGILYHAYFTETGMPISRLDYYDVINNERWTVFEVQVDRFDRTDFYNASWSPSGRYILIRTSAGTSIYNMRTASSHQLFLEDSSRIIGWTFTSSTNDENWLRFPEG